MIKELEQYKSLLKISASNPFRKDCKYARVVLRKVTFKGHEFFQAESIVNNQAFHQNILAGELGEWCSANLIGLYKQICLVFHDKDVTYLYSNKGSVKRLEKKTAIKNIEGQNNNRSKKYILNEGDNIPVFVELGIFTKDLRIVHSMYDKFKQINRFVEILNDIFKNYDRKEITILDFGCGKSYLTFVIYHYFTKIKSIKAKIIGYDIKSDVVQKCNALAQKYRYDNLHFVVADVSKDNLYDEKIDVVVSLHACDTATDYALHYAVRHNAKYIFSVPCCQHEVNSQITASGDLDIILKYGIVKERVSALLTDSIRAMLLEDEGYSVDVMEFVDLAHSPKNLMIRAVKTHSANRKNAKTIFDLMHKYKFKQTLYNLLNDDL